MTLAKNIPAKHRLISEADQIELQSAYEISQRVLKNAYNDQGINAGETHFSDVWIRDCCFAGWGALSLNDTSVVQGFLRHALANMKEDGQCPLRIGQKYFLLKYLHLTGPKGPTYIEDKYVSIPVDSNALIIILFEKYILESNDQNFLDKHLKDLIKVIDWYQTQSSNNLIVEGPYAGWADSLKKTGHVLYSNVLYAKALKSMVSLTEKKEKISTRLAKQYEKTTTAIVDVFWNGSYLIDYVNETEKCEHLSLDGNVLAVVFDIIDTRKQKKLLRSILSEKMLTKHGAKLANKVYDNKVVYPPFLLINLKDYHNGLIWFWVCCVATVALYKNDFKEDAFNLFKVMAKKITRDNTMYEVYEPKKGKAVKRLFYKSEQGFAWSAGLFVWAYQELFNKPK
ncbi:MAG: amylo-alpha-1,6-glucosidase [Candidatus Marinamargulisbacteria bacterium]